jgi:hypothetical protein
VGVKSDYLAAWIVACLGIGQLAGCCCNDPCVGCPPEMGGRAFRQVYEGVGPGCFGYHTTCWSPWPDGCPTCPAPSPMPAAAGTDHKTGPETAPNVPTEPIPTPVHPVPPSAPQKPAEPGQDPGSPAPDPAPAPEPGKSPRPLESKPPTTSSRFENEKFQNNQTGYFR